MKTNPNPPVLTAEEKCNKVKGILFSKRFTQDQKIKKLEALFQRQLNDSNL